MWGGLLLNARDLDQIWAPGGRELLKQNLKCVALVWGLRSRQNLEEPRAEDLQGLKDREVVSRSWREIEERVPGSWVGVGRERPLFYRGEELCLKSPAVIRKPGNEPNASIT